MGPTSIFKQSDVFFQGTQTTTRDSFIQIQNSKNFRVLKQSDIVNKDISEPPEGQPELHVFRASYGS